jgi:hypothetical protein
LEGLIVMGNAWQSVDIFNALGFFTSIRDDNLKRLAIYRQNELLAEGKQSLAPSDFRGRPSLELPRSSITPDVAEVLEGHYRMLRQEAEQWHLARTAYMMARLRQGQHPDTHSNFWAGWTDYDPPAIPEARQIDTRMSLFMLGGGLLFVAILLKFKRRRRIRI